MLASSFRVTVKSQQVHHSVLKTDSDRSGGIVGPMEDSSQSDSDVENKGTSARNVPMVEKPVASCAGRSPGSEVHIVSFHCFFFFFLFLSLVHLPLFLCIFFHFLRFGPGTLLNCLPPSPRPQPPPSLLPPDSSDKE